MRGGSNPFEGDCLHAGKINDALGVDVLLSVCGVSFAELQAHVEWLGLDGERTAALDLNGLPKTKRGVWPKDQADARVLGETLRRRRGES